MAKTSESDAPQVALPEAAPAPATSTPDQPVAPVVEEEPRTRIEQWASAREKTAIGRMELLMAYTGLQEAAGHIIDVPSAFEAGFQAFCNAPVD